MNITNLLSGFINEQVFGLALLLLIIGLFFANVLKIKKKQMPIIFVIIAIPISIMYHIFLSPELHIIVRVLNGLYQSFFSIFLAMGIYDLGKYIIVSIKNRFKSDNQIDTEVMDSIIKETNHLNYETYCPHCGNKVTR
ncbi:MAG: hypothetical protein RR806_05625 [Oscillospiraceae bacterium]